MARELKPPYTSANDIDAFFERIRNIGEPKNPITSEWIANYNLANSQPSGIVSMLKWLGIITENGDSTGLWNKIRVPGNRAEELRKIVETAYSSIFDAVDVSAASRTDLEGAFISAYDAGAPRRLVNCFLALCGHAGIETAVATRGRTRTAGTRSTPTQRDAKDGSGESTPKQQQQQPAPRPKVPERSPHTSTVNIMLNVDIPAEWNESQIRERVTTVAKAVEDAGLGDS